MIHHSSLHPQSEQKMTKVTNKIKFYSYQKYWKRLYNWLYYDVEKGVVFHKVYEQFLVTIKIAIQRSQGIFNLYSIYKLSQSDR